MKDGADSLAQNTTNLEGKTAFAPVLFGHSKFEMILNLEAEVKSESATLGRGLGGGVHSAIMRSEKQSIPLQEWVYIERRVEIREPRPGHSKVDC